MEVLRVGQILVSKEDHVVETCLGNERKIPAGNKIIIGADRLAHHIKTGMVQGLGAEFKVEGYDTEGIAKYLWLWLNTRFPLADALQGYDLAREDFVGEVEIALDELGFD